MMRITLPVALAGGILLSTGGFEPVAGAQAIEVVHFSDAAPALAITTAGARGLDTILVARNPLEETALQFARAWASGAPARMAALLTGGGIRLQLGGQAHAGLSVRQAAAAIRDFLRDHEEGQAVLLRAAPASGSPDRGSAVVQWSARMAGTSQRIEGTLFLGLVQDRQGRWWIDEIRLVR
jgi:hypothetical protein